MYKLRPNGFIRRLSDGADIPPRADNADYRAFQKWVSEGNAPAADDQAPFTPTDFSNPDNLDITLRALLRTIAWATGKPLPDVRQTFTQQYRNIAQGQP